MHYMIDCHCDSWCGKIRALNEHMQLDFPFFFSVRADSLSDWLLKVRKVLDPCTLGIL